MKDKNMVKDILDIFNVERNEDRRQWEFEPTIDNVTSYTAAFSECETKEEACTAVWRNLKNKQP